MSCFFISHVRQSALSLSTALHPLPTQLHPIIKEPMGTRKLIVCPGISAPCCRADLLTPVPLPSAHYSSSLSPLQHTLDECNSYESGSVLLTWFDRRQFYPWDVTKGWWGLFCLEGFQWHSSAVPVNDELMWLIINVFAQGYVFLAKLKSWYKVSHSQHSTYTHVSMLIKYWCHVSTYSIFHRNAWLIQTCVPHPNLYMNAKEAKQRTGDKSYLQ